MKTSKKILSLVLTLIMVFSVVPMTDLGIEASAAGGVKAKLDAIKAVYPAGSYFTVSGGLYAYDKGAGCQLSNIPARGGLSSGATAANVMGEAWSCCGFARYVFYNIFGSGSMTQVSLNSAKIGDYVVFSGHYGIYLSHDASYVYVYDSNFTTDSTNRVGYNTRVPMSRFSAVYRANNYNDVDGGESTNYDDPIIERVYWGDNGTTTHFRPVVQIKNPETVESVLFPTWSHNGDGAQHNLIWAGSVFNGGLCWFNDLKYDNFSYQLIESHCYVYGKNGSVQNVSLPRNYNRNFTYSLDVNMLIDGVRYNSGASGFTFDYYIDGNLVANDVSDWAERHRCGQTYEIKDIKSRAGYVASCSNLSGVISSETEVLLTFAQSSGVLDLNGFLDGGESGAIGSYGTADIYLNGSLVSSGCWDYCETLPAGTKYEIKNIKPATGKQYNGVYAGSLSGTITAGVTTVILNFSTTAYTLYFDVNHNNVKPNLYKPTKSSKTINGVNYSYDLTTNTMLLNGVLTENGQIDKYNYSLESGATYQLTADVVSGSVSGALLVVEAVNSAGDSVGTRTYFDMGGVDVSKTWTISSTQTSEIKAIKTWIYKSSTSSSFSNYVIKIKLEKLTTATSSGTEFSPCMKGMHYGEGYGTLMTPTRNGYTFDGWYTSATGGTKITSSSKYPASNQTLYAHWTCNHNSTEVRNAKTATCTATGYTGDTYCKTCGTKTKTGTTTAKTAHNSNIKIPAVAATCTKTGLTEGKKCSVCGTITVAQQTVAKKAHTEVIDKAVSATCTKTGLTQGKHCSVCGIVTVAQQTVSVVAHIDNNTDYNCDYGCGYRFDKPAPEEPTTPDTPDEPTKDCSCNCHKGGLAGLFFKIINFFQKLFGMNKVCACGVKH